MTLCTVFATKKQAEAYNLGLKEGFEGSYIFAAKYYRDNNKNKHFWWWFELGFNDARNIKIDLLQPLQDIQDSMYEEIKNHGAEYGI